MPQAPVKPVSNRAMLGCVLVPVLALGGCVAYFAIDGNSKQSSSRSAGPAPVAASSPAVAPGPTGGLGDIPAFDQAGDGPDCSMTYGTGPGGNVVTVITLAVAGTLVTHVDGPGGQHIHTQAEPAGSVSFGYGFPLSQASAAGAVFYPGSGPREDCAIGPAR